MTIPSPLNVARLIGRAAFTPLTLLAAGLLLALATLALIAGSVLHIASTTVLACSTRLSAAVPAILKGLKR